MKTDKNHQKKSLTDPQLRMKAPSGWGKETREVRVKDALGQGQTGQCPNTKKPHPRMRFFRLERDLSLSPGVL
jgi:hypothetical protein